MIVAEIILVISLHFYTKVIWESTTNILAPAVVLSSSALLTPRQNWRTTETAAAYNSIPRISPRVHIKERAGRTSRD